MAVKERGLWHIAMYQPEEITNNLQTGSSDEQEDNLPAH